MDIPTNRFPVVDSLPQAAQQRALVQANQGALKSGVDTPLHAVTNAKNDSSPEKVNQAINQIAASVNESNRGLAFDVDHDSGRPIVKITDIKTGDLIRQIPSEDILALAKKLDGRKGVLFYAHA